MLKETFIALLKNYSDDFDQIQLLWNEVEKCHSEKNRHYHTLQHLESLLLELIEIKDKIQYWDCILFSLFYHDIIYHIIKSNNEEKSAALAEKRMNQISVPKEIINRCKAHILATKSHKKSTDSDTNYFTDADLSILGQPSETYSQYCKDVRNEFSIYPDFVYNAGRKKVINHFLTMKRIYKTDYFYQKYEQMARRNLTREIAFYG
ncbi:MAG: hypothetical protein JJU02_05275 [Cryomorphaceae bacterium]|nr:hypothetical protein [Cryomorphaceae bacterium]